MNTKEIEILLEKYYEGQTTKDEEYRLKKFFQEEIVPPHMAADADLFRSMAESAKEEIQDPGFETRFLEAIGEPKVVSMVPKNRRLVYITSLAAGILLIAGVVLTLRFQVFDKNQGAIDSKTALAYTETQKALLMLSKNFNSGMEQVQKFQVFDKGVSQVYNLGSFDRGVQQVKKFSDFYKFQTVVINTGK
jgi:hypothetical protein